MSTISLKFKTKRRFEQFDIQNSNFDVNQELFPNYASLRTDIAWHCHDFNYSFPASVEKTTTSSHELEICLRLLEGGGAIFIRKDVAKLVDLFTHIETLFTFVDNIAQDTQRPISFTNRLLLVCTDRNFTAPLIDGDMIIVPVAALNSIVPVYDYSVTISSDEFATSEYYTHELTELRSRVKAHFEALELTIESKNYAQFFKDSISKHSDYTKSEELRKLKIASLQSQISAAKMQQFMQQYTLLVEAKVSKPQVLQFFSEYEKTHPGFVVPEYLKFAIPEPVNLNPFAQKVEVPDARPPLPFKSYTSLKTQWKKPLTDSFLLELDHGIDPSKVWDIKEICENKGKNAISRYNEVRQCMRIPNMSYDFIQEGPDHCIKFGVNIDCQFSPNQRMQLTSNCIFSTKQECKEKVALYLLNSVYRVVCKLTKREIKFILA